MVSTPAALTDSVLRKAIGRYRWELAEYRSKGETELNLRPAFQRLLADMARLVNLTLMHEMTIDERKRIRPDGALVTNYGLLRGYWEAKGPKGNLDAEIDAKRRAGYPLDNALFENTVEAVLFQDGRPFHFKMDSSDDVAAMLRTFLDYQKPEHANFEKAVLDFRGQIPNIAHRLLELINQEHTRNSRFIAAFNAFYELCQSTLNPKIGPDEIKEMLVQHLLTERLFRTVFNNPDFVNKNAIAVEIEKVIRALTSQSFNRSEFLCSLDPFYVAIEDAARTTRTWAERQSFLNTVYERFFQGFAVQKADTLGTVYTPQEIVDFMVASVDEVLQREFGRGLATPGVKILDPCVGTGNFVVNIIKRIAESSRGALREKYARDLFCNEVALLPYYIASMNIEHEYYEQMKEYAPFEGICFVDTLELAESQQLPLWMTEENTERIKREKEAEIMVVIGNPPYNVGQVNENDNNKNRKYPVIDQQIRETYARASRATNKNALADMYVKFFRWATDRLQGRDGVVCLVTNNSFVDQIAFDGMRQHLLKDFTQIYHLDLHGNVRKNPKISGTKHNVFGIQVGVGITIAVRSSKHTDRKLCYYRVPEDWTRIEKLDSLRAPKSISDVEWLQMEPDVNYTWLTEGLHPEFATFLSIGDKLTKSLRIDQAHSLFKLYSGGVKTNRDEWVYDFSKENLADKIQRFINTYNSELDRWNRRNNEPISVDDFVIADDQKVKWSEGLKSALQRRKYAEFSVLKVREAMYRPFCKKWLFFDRLLNERVYQFPQIFSSSITEQENKLICAAGIGADHQIFFATNNIVDTKFGISGNAGIQCFPYYTYAEDGSSRRENITDWALEQFRGRYGAQVSKWDIFHYVYAMLHHAGYRERYAENLKRDLPRIPLLRRREAFEAAVGVGRALMELHVNYEQQPEYPLRSIEDSSVPYRDLLRVEKMRLSADRSSVVVNRGQTLANVPQECFRYRLGNRSALEWVIDQYQVTRDPRSGITSDPNRPDDPEYIVRLVRQVVTVSVETVRLVDELAQAVTVADWLEESH